MKPELRPSFLFLAPRFHTNQADLVRKLVEEGHRVDFIVMSTTAIEDHSVVTPHVLALSRLGTWLDRRFNPSGDPTKRSRCAIPRARELWNRIQTLKPEVTVVRGLAAPYVLLALPALRLLGSRVLLYTQEPRCSARLSMRQRFKRFLLGNLLAVRWLTPVDSRLDCSGLEKPDERLRLVPFFKYPSPQALTRAYSRNGVRFLAVGKYEPRKNLPMVVRAFKQSVPLGASTLTIVGECSRKHHETEYACVQALIAELGLEQRVTLHRNVPPSAMPAMFLSHDVFLLASEAEPASFSQIEAMAHGLAVICSRDNGAAHYVVHGETGLHCEPTLKSVAVAITAYSHEPALASRHGAAGLAHLTADYSIDRAYAALIGLAA